MARTLRPSVGLSAPPDVFLRTVQHQQIAPTCYHLLESAELLDTLPAKVRAGLQAASIDQWQRSERWARELVRILEHFEHRRCGFTVLKGIGLAILDYGGPDRRAYTDLDLLVRPSELDKAIQALEDAGYRRQSVVPHSARLSRHLHHTVLERGPFSVDLHHSLRAHPTFKLAEHAGHRQRRPFTMHGSEFFAPSASDQLLVLLLGQHVDIALGMARWKNLIDSVVLLRNNFDGNSLEIFLEDRRSDGTLGIAVNGLSLVATLFTSLPGLSGLVRLQNHAGLLVDPPGGSPTALFADASLLEKKAWSLQQYQQSPSAAWWNWLHSLPLLAWVHRPTRSSRNKTAARK